MKNIILILFYIASVQTMLSGQLPDPFIGDYRGVWTNPTSNYQENSPQITAQVIGLGKNRYQITFRGEYERRATPIFVGTGLGENGVVPVDGADFNCLIENGTITGAGVYKSEESTRFELSRFERLSPTLGRPAPSGAIVLYDGDGLDAWKHVFAGKDIDPVWTSSGGILKVVPMKAAGGVGGDLVSRQTFKSCELHLEFRLPYKPDDRGQDRANSGIFLQGVYEVQILDSFGLVGDWVECGALYKVAPPKVNRCSPPGQWQTYDIIFKAAEYDSEGVLLSNPVVTVRHNGKLIHNQQELSEIPHNLQTNRLKPHPAEAEPIKLQDHGHPVEFRNIWLVEAE